MGQCRTLDADVTIGCYCGDYSSCDNTIPTSLFIWNTCVCGAGGQAAPVCPSQPQQGNFFTNICCLFSAYGSKRTLSTLCIICSLYSMTSMAPSVSEASGTPISLVNSHYIISIAINKYWYNHLV